MIPKSGHRFSDKTMRKQPWRGNFAEMAEIEGDSAFRSGRRFAMIASPQPHNLTRFPREPAPNSRESAMDETAMALQLRPNCEYCDKDLPPNAVDARICSYECTFCADCVETKLHNVCPNCGGGFAPRPIRPATERRPGVCVTKQLPSDKRVHLKSGPTRSPRIRRSGMFGRRSADATAVIARTQRRSNPFVFERARA
jgi:hypothetical protein